jgi:creatinine amidohydrolase/Fe(II)-dependent formamide hydrolase-like protein
MKRLVPVLGLAFVFAATLFAQDPPPAGAGRQGQAGGRQGGRGPALPPIDPPKEWLSANRPKELIEFDMMTWPEVYDAIHHQGKTVALYYTGGTEHRGPQNVNGGHTLMARETVKEIARRLGNAIVLPVIPYSSNNASAQQTGTLGLTDEIQGIICERIAEQAITNGFTTVVFLNDHGGGVNVYREIAKKLEDKYRAPELASRNIHVFYADRVYGPAQDDFNKVVLEPKGLPVSGHAGIPDTSEMMYLGKDKNWTRTDLLKYAVTMGPDYVPAPPAPRGQGAGQGAAGAAADPNAPRGQGAGRAAADPNAPRIVASGVSGDGRQSTEALGKQAFEMKVDYAVKQIQDFLASIK